MIDGEGARWATTAATLDDLFRRAGVRHPDALALADPPNRDAFAWGAPRKLSFAQADRAISACAARLRGLGLQTDSIVAMHLPNTAESIITFLGVLRAG
jgi:acyl-CoA synthetase (AMP-forming)/AMP-acid ligase II